MKKEEREACWKAKELLFECLDQNKEDISKCEIEFMKLQNLCPESWVNRFIGKRKFDREKEDIIKKWGDRYVEERRRKVEAFRRGPEQKNKQDEEF